jgi:hypothetical protein
MNINDLSHVEISAAIHYLDPDSKRARRSKVDNPALAICVSLMIVLSGCIALILLYHHIS